MGVLRPLRCKTVLRRLMLESFLCWVCNNSFCVGTCSLWGLGLRLLVQRDSLSVCWTAGLPGSRFPAVSQRALRVKVRLQEYLSLLSFVKFTVGVPSLRGPEPRQRAVEPSGAVPKAPCSCSIRKLLGLPVGFLIYLTRLFIIAS